MPKVDPYWVKVIKRERVWSGAHKQHKMGWAEAGIKLYVKEEYKGWLRFTTWAGFTEIRARDDMYPEWWIEKVATAPTGTGVIDPDPDPSSDPSDEEIGRVVRYLFGK